MLFEILGWTTSLGGLWADLGVLSEILEWGTSWEDLGVLPEILEWGTA